MSAPEWLPRLYGLLARFSELGIGAELSELSKSDLWGVYRFLRRMAGEE
jgi:hypothetical protein